MAKTTLTLLAKLTVTCLLLYLVVRNLEVAQLADRLASLAPLPLVAAALSMGVQLIGVVSWRWHKVLGVLAPDLAPKGATRGLTRIVTISLLFNQFLPSTLGGDGLRLWLLHRNGVALGLATRSVIIDRICGFFALMLMAFLGAGALLLSGFRDAPIWLPFALSGLGMACIAGAPVLLRAFAWVPIEALRHNLESMAREITLLQGKRGLLLWLLLVSFIGHGLITLSAWLTALGLGVHFSLAEAFMILPPVLFLAALPISIAGWGVREGSMVLGLGLLGVPTGDAALVSILFGLLLLAYGLLGGLLWLIQRDAKGTLAKQVKP